MSLCIIFGGGVMREELLELIKDFKRSKRLAEYDEAKTKQGVVLNILNRLGWDTFNTEEVCPEYSVGDNRVDFALRCSGENKVFIEVKKIREDLEKYQEQLLKYSFKEGVKLSILTNGISWWFYLPLLEGSWEQRKFYTVEIYDQKTEDIVKNFVDFLSKKNVITGKAIKNAESIYKNKRKQYLIEDTLPKAWKKILTEPDELLVELLVETTEKLCGYKPEIDIVQHFLSNITTQTGILKDSTHIRKRVHKSKSVKTYTYKRKLQAQKGDTPSPKVDYTGKSIVSFTSQGEEYRVNTWISLLFKICEIMWKRHRYEFDKIFSVKGKKRIYFSHVPQDMRLPRKLSLTGASTNIYMETHFNSNRIVEITYRVLKAFNYHLSDLVINTK